MTFTELEYVLMLAVAVMLWRGSVMQRRLDDVSRRADRYADYLINVGKGKGSVIKNEEGTWTYKGKESS
jgi:hypothetical protein